MDTQRYLSTTMTDGADLKVIPSGAAMGAAVHGVDLSKPIDEATFSAIHQAWREHLALVFKDQHLTDAQLIAFSQQFGELHRIDPKIFEYERQPDDPDYQVEVISNIEVKGRPIGALGSGEATWHTDMSMYEEPAAATFLYALEVPPSGGNTHFANLYLAYETLSDELKTQIDGRYSIHDISYTAQGNVRPGFEPVTDKTKSPGARHPIVRTHPETQRRSIYLGREGYGYILGLSVSESDALLDRLWQHMTEPRFVWEHMWSPNDLMLWDNRCSVHRRDAFDPNTRRLMHRTSVKGDRPN